jgi:hypothetical protein
MSYDDTTVAGKWNALSEENLGLYRDNQANKSEVNKNGDEIIPILK